MAWTKQDLKRAYACNTELLRYFRECKGWTQADLAREAGYSERLVSKAESGKEISTATIDDVAGALSSPTQIIHPEDLIGDPVKLAKEFMAAIYVHGKHAFAAVRHFVDDEIVVKVKGDPAVFPFAGEYRGSAEFERMLSIFFTVLEPPANHNHEPWYRYVSNGTEVVVIGQSWLQPIGRPVEKPMPLVHHFQFCRGKMTYFDDHYDTHYGSQALGTSPDNNSAV